MQNQFDQYKAERLQSKTSDGKWNVKLSFTFKAQTAEDVSRISTTSTPTAESYIELKGCTTSNAIIGGNLMRIAGREAASDVNHIMHENMHNMGFVDQYINLPIVNKNGEVLNDDQGKRRGTDMARVGFENDILAIGDPYLDKDGKIVTPEYGKQILTTASADMLAESALKKRQENNGANELIVDDILSDKKGEVPFGTKSNGASNGIPEDKLPQSSTK